MTGGRLGDETGDTDLQARRRAVLDQKQYVSSKIGEACRFIGFGLVAIAYALLSSDKVFAQDAISRFGGYLKLAGALGAATVLFDYVQYVSGYVSANSALSRSADGEHSYLFKKSWPSYKLRELSFVLKQAFALLGAIILTIVMVGLAFS